MTSIRRRTALLVAESITALLVVGGAALFFVLRLALAAQFDEALAARADALRSITHFDGVKVEMDFAREAMPRFAARVGERAEDVEYFVAWVGDGEQGAWRVLERSGSLAGRDWPAVENLPSGAHNLTLPGEGARAGRAIMDEFTARWEGDEERAANPQTLPPRVRVLVAASRAPLDRSLAAIAWSIAVVGGILALGSVVASRWAVLRGLSPLHDLAERVSAISPSTLDARFEAGHLPTELRPIAVQLSALLARLHAAFEREKRFTSAASHELRTPIAELRILLEVAASQPRTSAEWIATSERALGVLDRAQSLCEALLRLSRAESGEGGRPSAGPLALAPILAEQATRAVAIHGGDTRRLRVDCPPGLTVRIDPVALATIAGNLFDNALRHGDVSAERPAECVARAESDGITITIRDYAPTLSSADVLRLFEPFWQADPSRARREGFGLGLSVCRTLAKACGGRIDAAIEDHSILALTVRLPADNISKSESEI